MTASASQSASMKPGSETTPTRTIQRLFIANRGEIALRVIRTCQRLGIETILGVSAADADSVPARTADRTAPRLALHRRPRVT